MPAENMSHIVIPSGLKGRRLLLVDDYDSVRTTMAGVLEQNGFDVVTAANVPDALRLCCNQKFDVLLCDLHMPRPGDGFTVISAMRHCNPEAVTILYSGYPALNAAMSEILLQADEILVKPLIIPDMIAMINQRLSKGRASNPRGVPGDNAESVAMVLQRESAQTIADWLERVKASPELAKVRLTDAERTAHLPRLFVDLLNRLLNSNRLDAPASDPESARHHGEIRCSQGYTAALIVEESRMLQVSIFKTLQSNLHALDFSRLLFGVMTIADEVDLQLKQAMDAYLEADKEAAKSLGSGDGKKPPSTRSSSHDQLRRNTRIIAGNYIADIFVDETSSTLFHWTVQRSDAPGVVALGEQSTYDIARQEGEHHLTQLVAADKTPVAQQSYRATGT